MDDMSQMGGIDMLRDHLTGKQTKETKARTAKRKKDKETPSFPLFRSCSRMFCYLN